MGNPAQKPVIPSFESVFIKQSGRPLYGIVPSGWGFCFCNLVFTLSKGKEKNDVHTEDTIDALTCTFAEPGERLKDSLIYSLAVSYDTIIATFKAIALVIVGTAPFHRPVIPSSETILVRALNTDV